MHLLLLAVSKKLKECTVDYLSLWHKSIVLALAKGREEKVLSCKRLPRTFCIYLLRTFLREAEVPGLQLNFSEGQTIPLNKEFFQLRRRKKLQQG